MSFTELPPSGSFAWQDPVTTFTALPTTDPAFTIRQTEDSGILYYFDGATWIAVPAAAAAVPVASTNSVTLTQPGGILNADVRLSTDAADVNYQLVELAIRSGASKGLRAQLANSLIRGLLSGTGLISYDSSTGVITLASSTVRALLSGTGLISYDNTTGVFTLSSATVRALFSATTPIAYDNATGAFTLNTVPIASGGTNSTTALNNNRVMQSSGGAIVEAAAITASRALASDANGIPVAATTTATELGFVNGVTSAIQTQLNGKEPTQTKGSISTSTTGVAVGSGANSTVGPNVTVDVQNATTAQNGLLTSADWNTFNGKQAAGNYITALTGDVAASGPGSVAATIQALAVTNAKIANATIDLTTKVTNTLPVVSGGTNSATALNNSRVMQSSAGAIVEAAAITASRALASDANGIPVASATTATQLGYLSGTTGALSSPQAPNVNMWLYVSQYGSDVTGDGTYNKPYATTAAARTSIGGNNSSTNRYGIHIRGTVTEASIYLLPYVWYYGDTWGNSRLNANVDNAIKLDPTAFTAGNSRSGMTNIYLGGSTGINLDFVAVSASGSHVVEIASIGVNGAVVINSNNTNQYFQWMGDSLCFSNFTVHGTLGLIQGVFIAGNLITDNGTAGIVSSGINFIGCFIGGNFTHTGDGTHANLIQFNSSFISGNTTATGASSTIYADSASLGLKSTVSIGSGASLVRLNDVYPLAYTPTTSGNWTVVPANAQDALDTLATEVTGKEPVQTKGSISTSTTGVTVGSGASSTVGPNVTVNVQTATTAQPGLLSAADWTTFNGKQAAGSYITALTGDVTASGPGSSAATIAALAVTNAKIANSTIDLTAKVTGVLPVANGGTNNSTALNSNRFAVTSTGSFTEAAAIAANVAIVSDANGLPVGTATTTTEIGYVHGVTSNIQTQLNAVSPLTIVSVSSNVTLTNYGIHLVDTSSARNLTLPVPLSGVQIVVKDATGSAATNNISILQHASEQIETVAATYVLANNLGSWTFTSNGTNWFII